MFLFKFSDLHFVNSSLSMYFKFENGTHSFGPGHCSHVVIAFQAAIHSPLQYFPEVFFLSCKGAISIGFPLCNFYHLYLSPPDVRKEWKDKRE